MGSDAVVASGDGWIGFSSNMGPSPLAGFERLKLSGDHTAPTCASNYTEHCANEATEKQTENDENQCWFDQFVHEVTWARARSDFGRRSPGVLQEANRQRVIA